MKTESHAKVVSERFSFYADVCQVIVVCLPVHCMTISNTVR